MANLSNPGAMMYIPSVNGTAELAANRNGYVSELGVGPKRPFSILPESKAIAGFIGVCTLSSIFLVSQARGVSMYRVFIHTFDDAVIMAVSTAVAGNYLYAHHNARHERVKRKTDRQRARYMGPVAREQPLYDLVQLKKYVEGSYVPEKALEARKRNGETV